MRPLAFFTIPRALASPRSSRLNTPRNHRTYSPPPPPALHASYTHALTKTIFPDNAYGVDSGGDPTAIPDLTFEYFKGFHQRFYHPGNSRVYFYGDDPPLKVSTKFLPSYPSFTSRLPLIFCR